MTKKTKAFALIPFRYRGASFRKYRPIFITGIAGNGNLNIIPQDKNYKWAIAINPELIIFNKHQADTYNQMVDVALNKI